MTRPVTRELVELAAADLAEDRWHFTRRQLYYRVCARAETPRSHAAANGEVGLGVLLILVGLILIGVRVAFLSLVSLGVVLMLAGVAARVRRPPPPVRVLTLSQAEFESRFGVFDHPRLIDVHAPLPDRAAPPGATVIVCDLAETAAMVAANLEAGAIEGVAVIDVSRMPSVPAWRRAIVLHDASPRGCATPLEVRDSGLEAVDAGLRPREVDSIGHQVLEGAPARLPRDLGGVLDPDEVSWLLSGRRVELATLSPRQAMAAVATVLRDGA